MSEVPIIKSVGVDGGINIFNEEYVPSNTANYNLTYKTFFTLPYDIDSIDTIDDLIVIGISEIQSVYIYKIVDTAVNIVKIITPQNSNILGTVKFGSCVKINQMGIFVSDPYYNTYGQVFLYYSKSINSQTWNTNPVSIRPFDYKNIEYSSMFGKSFEINDSTLYVSSPNYKDVTTNTIGKCYFYSIDYNTKYISNIMSSSNPDKNIEGFGNNILLTTPTISLVSSSNANVTSEITYNEAGIVYIYDTTVQTYIGKIQSPYPSDNSNFGFNMCINGSYLLISEPNDTEGKILVYKGGGTNWVYNTYFNIESLKIDNYNNSYIEGLKVFCINNLFLWTYNNIVYASEMTEAGNIVPSTTDKLYNTDYEQYGTNISNIGNNKIIITGYDSSSNKTIFNIYTINYV